MSRFGVFWLPWLRTAALGSCRLKSAAAIDAEGAPRMLARTQAYMGAPICAEMGAPSARKDGPAMKKADRAAMGAPSSAAIRLPAGVSMVKYVGIGHVQIIVSSTSSEPERNNRLATFAKLRSICIRA